MEFIKILKRLKGAYVFLGLVDLTDISGEIKSINDDGEILLEIGENEIYVMILNPRNH